MPTYLEFLLRSNLAARIIFEGMSRSVSTQESKQFVCFGFVCTILRCKIKLLLIEGEWNKSKKTCQNYIFFNFKKFCLKIYLDFETFASQNCIKNHIKQQDGAYLVDSSIDTRKLFWIQKIKTIFSLVVNLHLVNIIYIYKC